ncbi:MAG: VOC family protein [Bacteroidota bacterium]
MDLHHVGCLTLDMEASLASYQVLMGEAFEASKVYDITDQKVKVCFVKMTDGVSLELVQPLEESSSLARLHRKKGVNFYHMGFKVAEIDAAIESLVQKEYRLINKFSSEAFGMKTCAFLYNPELHLIELIEQ